VKGEIVLGKSSNYVVTELMNNLNRIHERFPASTFSILINAPGETAINSTAVDSTDETWVEANLRHLDDRRWHDNDHGGNHPNH
jgi:hypothetical protein